MFDAIRMHTQVPQLLGQYADSLVDKAVCHVHATLLEAGSTENLDGVLSNFVVWCADMGTEIAMPSFEQLAIGHSGI